jgi:hypothetical protein
MQANSHVQLLLRAIHTTEAWKSLWATNSAKVNWTS